MKTYYCLDCEADRAVADDGAEVTCEACGGFRMVEKDGTK